MIGKKTCLALLLLSQTQILQAQEIIDPIPVKPKVKLSHFADGFYNLDEKVYFVGRFGQRYSFLQLDPVTKIVSQVAEIPKAYNAWPATGKYFTGPDTSNIISIGNRLLMGDERVGVKEWFDPISGTFYSAFANKPNAHLENCRLSRWGNGPILACSVAYDPQNSARKLYYRLERTDGLFHAIQDTEVVSSADNLTIENGLFCYRNKGLATESCSEWPSQSSYNVPEGNSTRIVQHNHIFWLKENGEIVMQQRHSTKQAILSTAAQTTLLNSAGIIAVNSEHLLYVVAGVNGENAQIKRLSFSTQIVDNIDLGINPSEFLDQDSTSWHLTQNRSIHSIVDGSFIYRSKLGGIKLLKPDDTVFQLVQADPYTQWEETYPTSSFVELKDQLLIVGDSCALKDKYGLVFPVPEACAGRHPSFYLTSGQRIQKIDVSDLFAISETSIGQLTSWNKQLFWYERNEQDQWFIKRYNPKTQKIDIVSEGAPNSYKLLAGSSELWVQADYQGFFRFNPETIKFEFRTALPDQYSLSNDGILHGDSYYFVTSQTKEPPYNSFIHRFNLISGQIQTLKVMNNILPYPKLLGVHNNNLHLSFSRLADDKWLSSGGILNLSDLTLTFNQALADDSHSGLPTASFYLNKTFEFQNHLYAVGQVNDRNSLIQIDLSTQTRKISLGAAKHPVTGIERQSYFIFADKLFTSWGQQYAADGKMIDVPLTASFAHFVHYQDMTYVMSERQLEKLMLKNGMINSESNLLEDKLLISTDTNALELGGKLYFVARDIKNGERIRQIQLPNRPPVAKDDSATTNNTNKVTIAVLANDSDSDFDLLTVAEAKAIQGLVSILPDQQLSYQPNAGFSGTDEIQYQVTDGRGGVATAKVSVTVTATATEVPPVTKPVTPAEKSGGSLGFGWLALLGLVLGVRRHLIARS